MIRASVPTASPSPVFRLKRCRLREVITRAGLGAGLPLLMSTLVQAQGAEIEEIVVVDKQRSAYKIDQASMNKFTESLRDTPQSITTLSDELLEDRGAMSLNDALRNVPGITLGAGEFSWQGNNPNIRGFSSRNDMFLDGMRDFGSYPRDPFNLQSIEVLQGPSSMVFGRGSTGGVINQVSKTPVAEALRSLHVNVGNADTRRFTADLNQPLGERAALRLNLMQHESDVPGRNGAHAQRYGIAPSLSLNLGSATRLTLSYMKQHGEHVPDYGLPWINGEPAPVDRENFYGFANDYLDTDAEVSTVNLDHRINASLVANLKLRYADYERASRISEPQVATAVGPDTALDSVRVERFVFSGESSERMFQAQFNLNADFRTAGLEHALVAGLEASQESSAPVFGFGINVPSTSLINPVIGPFETGATVPRLVSHSNGDSLAAYVLDTLKLNNQWQLMAGVRWDRFDLNYIAHRFDETGAASGSEQYIRTDIETSYRTALIYKPVPTGTFYLGWGTSFNPSAEGLSFVNSGRNLTTSNVFLEPEDNRSVELGSKWDLLGGDLSLDAALFSIVKSNARIPDPENPGFNILAGEQQVDGISVNASGRVGERLEISGGYTWLDSEQKPAGSPLQNVAEHTLSLWANYTVSEQLEVGGGARFVDERLATASPRKQVPDYWVFDAMAKYRMSPNLTLKLNLTNLTDEYYFDQLHPWHVVPGPGFASVFAVNFDY